MKIGFVVSFFDFRNDVRRVMGIVAQQHQVVVFGRPEMREEILRHLPQNVEFREIKEKQANFWNKLWLRLYVLLKQIPKSRQNFFLMEFFKGSFTTDPTAKAKHLRLLRWIERLPKFISYDFYLNRLRYSGQTLLDDVDQFICFTAIADDFLMARLLHEKRAVKVYVYSWDHPCKHVCFSKRAHYLCWNDPIKKDIVVLQNINPQQVRVVGASQFGYVDEFKRVQAQFERTYPFRYVYIGCAIGVADLIADELAVINTIAQTLERVRPDLKLVVRPYPVQNNWEVYQPLRTLPNIVMDDQFRTGDLSIKDGHILEKFEKINHAEAFFHLGTTMGLEACFTNTPSFIIDFGYESQEVVSLYSFIHQYQNDHHLIELAPQNAVRSVEHLSQILEDLANPTYQILNQRVQSSYQIKSFEDFGNALIKA